MQQRALRAKTVQAPVQVKLGRVPFKGGVEGLERTSGRLVTVDEFFGKKTSTK